MHELSITQSVVDAVTRRMGDARVRRERLEVGRLSGLVPDAVQFCFEVVAAGTSPDSLPTSSRTRRVGDASIRRVMASTTL